MTNVRGTIQPAPAASPGIFMKDAMSGANGRRDSQFEAAKAASAQRLVVTASVADSIADSRLTANAVATTRRVDGRTFMLRDSVWTDARYHAGMTTTTIKPYSAAYFDLLTQLPELRGVLALGSRVIVVGRDRALAIAEQGVTQLSVSEMNALVKAW